VKWKIASLKNSPTGETNDIISLSTVASQPIHWHSSLAR